MKTRFFHSQLKSIFVLYVSFLLLLDTAPAVLLGRLKALLVGLGLGAAVEGTHHTSSLEGALQIANGRLAENVDLDELALESTLERDDAY